MSPPPLLTLDGSQHSGSGTLVRQAVALAALIGRPLRLYNVRARRQPPGLRPQHLRAVEAVAELVDAHLEDARVGSQHLTFVPRCPPRGGTYAWDIGTAGSATLLVQAVLPVLAFADRPTQAVIRGGLFQDFAPTYFHLRYALLPLLHRMGLKAHLQMRRPGYAPQGGGELLLEVTPLQAPLHPLHLTRQGQPVHIFGLALASHLKQCRVAQRMADRCRQRLMEAELPQPHFETIDDSSAAQPGAALAVFVETDTGALLGADQAGAPGRPSETIADHVARVLLEDLRSGATVDRYLADQLLPYIALASGRSVYSIPLLTEHVASSCWLVTAFLETTVKLFEHKLSVEGVAFQPIARRLPTSP